MNFFEQLLEEFKALGNMPFVLWTLVGVTVILILFILLFVVAVRTKNKVIRDGAGDKSTIADLKAANSTAEAKIVALTADVNTLTDANAASKDELKNTKLSLRETKDVLEATRVELASTKIALDEANAKIVKLTPKKKVKRKPAKKVEKPVVYTKEELDKLTKHELLTLAKARKLSGFYHINKDQLVDFILKAQAEVQDKK